MNKEREPVKLTSSDEEYLSTLPLSDEARFIINSAIVEAIFLGHAFVGTEHLLLACSNDQEIKEFLARSFLKVTATGIQESIEFIVGKGDKKRLKEVGLTPRVKTVLKHAQIRQQAERSAKISKFHILLGLSDEGEGIAASVLESKGVFPSQLFDAYVQRQRGKL